MKNKEPVDYIVHVMGYDSTKFGTLEKYVLKLIKRARLENLEIILVYNQEPKSEEFLKQLKDANVVFYVANALSIFEFWSAFRKITQKYKPIVVHSHFQPLLPSLYGWLLGYKYRWNTLRLMLVDKNIKEVDKRSELKISSRIYRFLINTFTNKFFCVSKGVYNQYSKIYPQQSKQLNVLYNGVEQVAYNKSLSRKKLNFKESIVYICCISFASKIKGLDTLIKAYKEFLEKGSEIETRLCLIGLSNKNPITDELLRSINEYGIADKVINFGIIDNVPEILPAMDIYIQPSRSESLSNALIEAGMFQIPAIGSNVGGIPEVIKDKKTGFLFPVEDYIALSKKIYCLVEDQQKRDAMGFAAKKHTTELFALDGKVDELIDYYLNL